MRGALALFGLFGFMGFWPACSVGEPTVARQAIIGGVRDTGDPAVVLLVSYPPNQSTFVTCTASVIAPTVLLTAAHCVDAANHPGHVYGVFTGDDASSYSTAAQIASQLLPVSAVHPHPGYDPQAPFLADIGIVQLAQAVAISPLPIARDPLPSTLPGQAARLVGYGQTTYQTYNAKKYAAATSVAALPDDDTVVVGDSQRHACLGDSGGPALVSLGGAEKIIGVDSYTDTSGCTQPAHYRRVDLYLPFIDAYAPPTTLPDLGAADLASPVTDGAVAAVDAGVDRVDAGGEASSDGGCAVGGRPRGELAAVLVVLLSFFSLRASPKKGRRMRVALAVLVSLSFAAPASAKKQSVDEGEVTFVFDDTKISPELVKSAARIRPDAQLTADVISSSPSMSLMKVSAKNGWQSWATWGPTWTKQAREELARLRKTSEELAQQKVPTELEPARDYYVNELATMAAREEAKMNYLEHHDVAALKKPIAGADVATKCAPATGKVVAAGTDAASVYKALYFDWSNCALNASSDKKYPQAAWTAFTKKYGVKTKHTSGD